MHRSASIALPLGLLAVAAPALAVDRPLPLETIQITATREKVPLLQTPASVTIITGDELRARGANDLRTAMTGIAGVEISPGGDSGPAGSVPAFWGLREFDAFLLVVDDVPWGGAFNPALTTLDLHDIDRIEVMRGAAPVMYGATSFVGVIHVIHNQAGQAEKRVDVAGGGVPDNLGNLSASLSESLPDVGAWHQSIDVNGERVRFEDEHAGIERGHVLYRLGGDVMGGSARLDLDLNFLRQEPTSPFPRVDTGLDPAIDTDANHNPSDAHLDDNRFSLVLGYSRDTGLGAWTTTLSLDHSDQDITRGFLADACVEEPLTGEDNACGYTQDVTISGLYFDTHVLSELSNSVSAVWGLDDLAGEGEQDAEVFAYDVNRAHGGDAPSSSEVLAEEEGRLEANGSKDDRNFLGVYGQLNWKASRTVDVLVGLRLNSTSEDAEGEVKADPDEPDAGEGEEEGGEASRDETRLSGSLGVTWTAWSQGADAVALFADYRNTFKPAAVDFGPEPEADILDPETSSSIEVGTKTRWLGGRLGADLSFFYMDMNNLVVPQSENGVPGLANAGTLYFNGGEVELDWRAADATTIYASYAHHELTFGDYVRDFDGVPTQLRGNTQELAPENTGSLGFIFAPSHGWVFAANYAYTGSRFLNKRNTVKVGSFEVVDASVAYRFDGWELRLSGYNLTDSRDPISESELGDAQYYRMPARSYELGASFSL
jgi:outer membrane receptor protein involved in Fe transport